jgi:hypothetical protein
MSEGTDSSAPVSEIAKPESIAPPKGGIKGKLWLKIAAIAIVAILVGTAIYVMFLTPLTAGMSPDEITIDAGQMKSLSVSVKKGISSLTDNDAVKYRWRLNPDTLATFNFKSKPHVNLTAGVLAGTGTLSCEITYKGETKTLTKTVTVKPPYLDKIIVSPTTKTLERGMSKVFKASAVDSVGNPVENLSYAWSVSGVAVTINATTGVSVNLTAGTTYGNASLSASATWQSVSKTGAANVIVGPLPPRKIDYVWYKMFDVPFGDWWNTRWTFYKTEKVLTNSYPYMFQFYTQPEGNVKVYANARLNITARNVTAINMNDNPEFLPLHGSSRGGIAVIDWYMEYLTGAEVEASGVGAGNNDGWVIGLNGTVTLDKEAAMSVIKGLSSSAFDTFSIWWGNHGTEVSNDIMGWMIDEAGAARLNINPAYDGVFQMMAGSVSGEKVGDKIVLTYNTVSWGMEALIMRWFHEAFMPTEWWFSDMDFHAVIGPEMTNLDIDTVVSYALYAFETVNPPHDPCWVFEGMVQDVNPSSPPDVPFSAIDPYMNGPDGINPWQYLNRAPGNAYYNKMMQYDYTPGAWNLSENETLTLNWPAGQMAFLVHVPAPSGSIYASTTPTNDTMVVRFSEPMTSDNSEISPGSMSIDDTARKVVFTGPIDMWDWAKNQMTYKDLSDNWSRIALLPHGVPWIEFQKEHGLPTWPATYVVSDVPEMPLIDTPVDITVAVRDNYNRAYPSFSGTIHFESNRTDVTLPSDYTFNNATDGGRHKFLHTLSDALTFHGTGYYWVNISTNGGNATGSYSNIWVIPVPEQLDHLGLEVLGVKGIVMKAMPSDVRVTAYNQYPAPHDLFKGYSGTVAFSTNAPDGTYTLPANTTFTPASGGVARLAGLMYDITGTFTLTVYDNDTPSISKTVTVKVYKVPKMDYRIYDMFEQPWGEWWPWRFSTYAEDLILYSKPHANTEVYLLDSMNLRAVIYAPYRWNLTATNMSTLSVHSPEFMPILGTPGVPVPGASADMHVSFQYLNNASWFSYWVPTWSSNWNWTANKGYFDNMMVGQYADGYILGCVYTVVLNRQAAEEWLGMPQTGITVADWWTANRDAYTNRWIAWILDEGNRRLDIWPAYADAYYDEGTLSDLVEEANGNVTLRIGHFSWGYECLITRWLNETALSRHEPYMEDFNMSVQYRNEDANVSFDAVAQYNLHAVLANGTVNDPAWVWEPQRIDYNYQAGAASGYTSEFNPWGDPTNPKYYNSSNSGDSQLGSDLGYQNAPTLFDLASFQTLTIQLPTYDVVGFMGEPLPCSFRSGAIYQLKQFKNPQYYENITVRGPMWLGYNMTGFGPDAPNLWNYYDNTSKTLSLVGPMNFDNYRFPDGYLYHAAPWIEFNVANVTWGAISSLPAAPEPYAGEPTTTSSAALSDLAMLGVVILATSLAVVALGAGARRKD